MLDTLIRILKLIFTPYLVGLSILCGIFLSVLFPSLIGDNEFKKEYKIGKITGYLYMGGSLIMYILVKLFS